MIMANASSTRSLSVVIPTYQREKRLCETLHALLGLRDSFLELIIVDQTPVHLPETQSFLEQLPNCARVIKMPRPNLPAARNAGAKEAKGNVILFLDDDINPLPQLFQSHTRHYEDQTVAGVAGRLLSPHGEIRNLDQRYYTSPFHWRYIRFDQEWELREVQSAPGGNMSFRRELIFKVGGFDENFVGNAFREETDFCIRLRRLPYRILFDPDAALVHYWQTEGGCDHTRFGNPNFISYTYYTEFVQNNFYFFLKHAPRKAMGELVWELYRNHIGNKQNLKGGLRLLFLRHVAFCVGVVSGFSAWRQWRRTPRGFRFV